MTIDISHPLNHSPPPNSMAAAGAPDRRMVRWERFLPQRSLRVLLVEQDDSTRHIVAALLRKCSYRVAAVADGVKAWEVVKERRCEIDLVLTEVETPSLSGIGLLANIMGSEECSNIPVIMMSTQDSIGVVLRCMLNGAVDFLVKPIRKNELRNLWQHVWRKHCSSSYANASENSSGSNHISANADDTSKTGENKDEGTDAQHSSGTSAEVQSIQKHMECQVADGRNFSREEAKLQQPENDSIMLAKISKIDADNPMRTGFKVTSPLHEAPLPEKSLEKNCSYDILLHGTEDLGFMRSIEAYSVDPKLINKAPSVLVQDMIGKIESAVNEQCGSHIVVKDNLNQNAREQNTSNFSTSPLWEISLRRPQSKSSVQHKFEGRHILNHSNSSAFSRYDDKRIHPFTENLVSSASVVRTSGHDKSQSHDMIQDTENANNTSDHPKKRFSSDPGNGVETSAYVSSNNTKDDTGLLFSEGHGEDACAAGHLATGNDSNKNDTGLLFSERPGEDACAGHSDTGNDPVFRHPQYGFMSMPISVGTVPCQSFCTGYGAILRPMLYPGTSLSPHGSAAAGKATIQMPFVAPVHNDNRLSDYSHSTAINYHEENRQSHQLRKPIDIKPRDPRDAACTPIEQIYQSGSCNQDILRGCSYGSGKTTDAGTNTETTLETGNESQNRKELNCNHSWREAALMKFRLKRKDRCFEKKVRYHSRKKLAEQRPRVKGQFVCQKIPNSLIAIEADD